MPPKDGGGSGLPELQALLARRLQWVVEQVDDVDRCVDEMMRSKPVQCVSEGKEKESIASPHLHECIQGGALPRAAGPRGGTAGRCGPHPGRRAPAGRRGVDGEPAGGRPAGYGGRCVHIAGRWVCPTDRSDGCDQVVDCTDS